jgi:hypothetical protein
MKISRESRFWTRTKMRGEDIARLEALRPRRPCADESSFRLVRVADHRFLIRENSRDSRAVLFS